ncbi:MAG: GNAT family N-acetyltransferase [Oscillospiraceae bacterium]
MIIRKADIYDNIAIAELSKSDLGYDCTAEFVRSKLEKLDESREAVFAAVCGDEVIGYVHVERYDTLYMETLANILGIAVRADFRRNGAGSLLIKAAESWARDMGAAGVRLNSGAERVGAHEFYRACGFNSEKQQIRFIKSF